MHPAPCGRVAPESRPVATMYALVNMQANSKHRQHIASWYVSKGTSIINIQMIPYMFLCGNSFTFYEQFSILWGFNPTRKQKASKFFFLRAKCLQGCPPWGTSLGPIETKNTNQPFTAADLTLTPGNYLEGHIMNT